MSDFRKTARDPRSTLVSPWLNRLVDWARSFSSLITRIRLCWAEPGSDPDSRLCCRPQGADTRWENVFSGNGCLERKKGLRQRQTNQGAREGMAPVEAVKVLLATCPRALLRSTLTAPTSAKNAHLRFVLEMYCYAELNHCR